MFGMDIRCIVCYGCVSFSVKVVRLPPHLSSMCVCMCEKKMCLLMFLCWNILYRGAPMNGSPTVKTSVNTVNICWHFFFHQESILFSIFFLAVRVVIQYNPSTTNVERGTCAIAIFIESCIDVKVRVNKNRKERRATENSKPASPH